MLGLDAYAVADGEIHDTCSKPLDNTRQLMPLLPWHVDCGRTVAAVVVQIGSTYAGRFDTDHDFPRSGFRGGPVLDPNVLFAVEKCGFHC